jgi:hypothetical protein
MTDSRKPFDPQNPSDFDRQLMESPFIQAFMNDMAQIYADALSLVTGAMAESVELAPLIEALRTRLKIAQASKLFDPTAIRMAAHTMRGLEAELAAQTRLPLKGAPGAH